MNPKKIDTNPGQIMLLGKSTDVAAPEVARGEAR
jgi:hypothetical protein